MMVFRRGPLVFRFLIASFVIVVSSVTAAAVDCNTDCNKQCPEKKLKDPLTNRTIAKFRDPTCKGPCEASKPISCVTGVKIPAPAGVLADFEKALNQSCSVGFELFTKSVIVGVCPGFATPADSQRIGKISKHLVEAKILSPSDFNNISIKFCKISAYGLAPDRNQVFLNEKLRDASDYELATTLAHEMKHIEQYLRAKSTDEFKCNYTRKFIDCGFCQDSKHPQEKEAYEFEDRARKTLAGYYAEYEPSFAIESNRSLLGTYGVAAGGCQPRVGPPMVYQRVDSVLVARNECGMETPLVAKEDGTFTATDWGGLSARYNLALSTVFWGNDTQWLRIENEHSLIGSWTTVAQGGCQPVVGKPSIYIRSTDGAIVARNECGNETEVRFKVDGRLVTLSWGGISALSHDQGRTIEWSNGTRWNK